MKIEPRKVVLSDGVILDLTAEQAQLVGHVLSDSPTFTPEQAAAILSVSRPMVVRWIRDGLLDDRPVGAHHRIPVDSVVALQKARRSAGRFAASLLADARDNPGTSDGLEEVRTKAASMMKWRDGK